MMSQRVMSSVYSLLKCLLLCLLKIQLKYAYPRYAYNHIYTFIYKFCVYICVSKVRLVHVYLPAGIFMHKYSILSTIVHLYNVQITSSMYKVYIKSSAYMYRYVYAISLEMYCVHIGCLQSIHKIKQVRASECQTHFLPPFLSIHA